MSISRVQNVLEIARSRLASGEEVRDDGPSDYPEHHAYLAEVATIGRAHDLRASIHAALTAKGFGNVAFDPPIQAGEGRATFRFDVLVDDVRAL